MNFSILNCTSDSDLLPFSIYNLFECYFLITQQNILITIFFAIFIVVSLILNIVVLSMIFRKKGHINEFDRILIACLIAHLISSGVDLPIYQVYFVFNYWPLDKVMCLFWSTLDSSINSVIIFNMLYLSWVRLVSFKKPKKYLELFYVRKPLTCIFAIWMIIISFYVCINYFFIVDSFKKSSCSIVYKPFYLEFIFNFVLIFLPLFLIILIVLYTIKVIRLKGAFQLHEKFSSDQTQHSSSSNKPNKRSLKARGKLSIMVVFFIMEWLPPLVIILTNTFCGCIPFRWEKKIYFLTFSGALIDPILIMILNSRYKLTTQETDSK